MSFFVSKELKGKIAEDDLVEDDIKIKNINPILIHVIANNNTYCFPVVCYKSKKSKVIVKFLVDQENNLFENAVCVKMWEKISVKTNGKNKYNIVSVDSSKVKLSQIEKSLSGYNYKITIIICK